MNLQPATGTSASNALVEPPRPARTLAISLGDDTWDLDERVAALWRKARLGPTVERLRRHVLQGGERSIEAGQFRALDAVAAHGPCSVRGLAVAMGLEPSTVTRATTRLADSGLIRKRRADHDQREVLVELTPEGRQRHQYFVDRAYAIYEEIFAVFSIEERVQLADFLDRMLTSTEEALERSGRPAKR